MTEGVAGLVGKDPAKVDPGITGAGISAHATPAGVGRKHLAEKIGDQPRPGRRTGQGEDIGVRAGEEPGEIPSEKDVEQMVGFGVLRNRDRVGCGGQVAVETNTPLP